MRDQRQSEAKTSKNVSEVISKDLQDLLVQFIMSRWAWFMMWNGGRTNGWFAIGPQKSTNCNGVEVSWIR